MSIEVGDQSGGRFETVDALVDTGATYTVLPSSILQRLGVVPHRRTTFELADGRRMELEMGRTWVRLDGQQEQTLVVFGNDVADAILGAVTLEEFLLSVDPVHQRLQRVDALLMSTGTTEVSALQ